MERESHYLGAEEFLSEKIGTRLDRLAQKALELFGRTIDYHEASWLKGPVGSDTGMTEDYFVKLAQEKNTDVIKNAGQGLIDSFRESLRGADFNPDEVLPAIQDFYEHTSDYALDLNVTWGRYFKSLARITHFLTHSVQQMNIPLINTREGTVQSDIYSLPALCGDLAMMCGDFSKVRGWVRKNPDTKDIVFAGAYSTAELPGKEDKKFVKVAFPVPEGNISVFLEPLNLPGGGFELKSTGEEFGDPGLYVVDEENPDSAKATYIKGFTQSLVLSEDQAGRIQARHTFAFRGRNILSLEYVITKKEKQQVEQAVA